MTARTRPSCSPSWRSWPDRSASTPRRTRRSGPGRPRRVFNGGQQFPADGKLHVGFSASTEIRRADFGVDFNMPLGVDRLALGEKVKVELEIQFVAP
jgi:hypothetical protein